MFLFPILWNYPIPVTAFWPCCLLLVFYTIVISALLIFILKSMVKILRKLSPKMDLQGIHQEAFFARSQCYLLSFSWGSFFIQHVSFLILIFFCLTRSFPRRHSIQYFIKVRINEIWLISFIRKYPIRKSYCTSLVPICVTFYSVFCSS